MLYNKRMNKRDRFFFLTALLPLVIFCVFQLLKTSWISRQLPFGFHYQYIDPSGTRTGMVPALLPQYLKDVIPDKSGKNNLVFSSNFFTGTDKGWSFHLYPADQSRLYINSTQIALDPGQRLQAAPLKSGFNRITVIFKTAGNDASAPLPLKFFLRGGDLPPEGCFWRWVVPGNPFSRFLFFMLRALQQLEYAGYYLALIIILVGLVKSFRNPLTEPLHGNRYSGHWFLVSLLFMVLSVFLLVVEITRNLKTLSLLFIGLGSTGAVLQGLAPLLKKKINWHWRPDWRALLVLAAALASLLFYVHALSGSLLPFEPVGGMDLNNHLRMIKHYEHHGLSLAGEIWGVYPQSIQAFLAVSSRLLGMEPEEALPLFQIAFMAGIMVCLFLLARDLLGGFPMIYLFLAVVLSNIAFVGSSLFEYTSYPAVFSCFLFLVALLLFLRGKEVEFSLVLGGATAVYPYFALAFAAATAPLLIIRFLSARKTWIKALSRMFLLFLPLAVAFFSFSFNYLTRSGMSVFRPGSSWIIWFHPFAALKTSNVFLILAGMYLLLRRREFSGSLQLAAGAMAGFLPYHLLYVTCGLFQDYYLRKNAIFLILVSIPFAGYSLHRMLTSRTVSLLAKTGMMLLVAIPVLLTYLNLHQSRRQLLYARPISINLPGKPYRGLTCTNRWLRQNCPESSPVLILCDNPYLAELCEICLNDRFRTLKMGVDLSLYEASLAWVIMEKHFSGSLSLLLERKEVFTCGDFSVWKPVPPLKTSAKRY